jgi:hypothetical protein
MNRLMVLLLIAVGVCAQAQSIRVLPASPGDPKKVATTVIREAEHPCPNVTSARRVDDESIVAKCSNGEGYRVFTVQKPDGRMLEVALRCSEARKLGVRGAC